MDSGFDYIIHKLENAWQSLAYSPLGVVVSPPSEYLWKTLTYWSPECLTAPSHCEHRWTKRGNNYRLQPYIFFAKTPGWLIRISPNFHEMYRNDCQLNCWNQNCDIPIHFRTPVCQMNENRPISAESQHNFFIFSPTLTQKLLNRFCHSISTTQCKDCENRSSGSWDTSAPSKQVRYKTKLVGMATSLEESEKMDLIKKIHANTFHLVKRSWKSVK